jgi:hypothetical protein
MPHSITWRSVAFGGGKFVAVSASGTTAAHSIDGASWVDATLPISASWRAIAYGGNRFVAVIDGSDQVAYGVDGANWSIATLSSSQLWSAITHGDGAFVAVATSSDAVLYSSANLFRYKLTSLSPRTWEKGAAVEGDPFLSFATPTVPAPITILEDTHVDSEGAEHFCISYANRPSAESTIYTLKIVNRKTDDFALIMVYIKTFGTEVSSFTMQQYGKFKPFVEYYRAPDFADTLRITLTNDAIYDIVAEAYSDGHKVDLLVSADDTIPEGDSYEVQDHSPTVDIPPPPRPITTHLRLNDIKANEYVDLKMDYVAWEPIYIRLVGVNKVEAYGRWNGTDASLALTVEPNILTFTPIGGGKVRMQNTSTGTLYGNLLIVDYRPSAVEVAK